MARHKKNNTVQEEVKPEVIMTEEAVLEGIQTEIDNARKELEATKLAISEKKHELSMRREVSEDEIKLKDKQVKKAAEKSVGEDIIEKQKAFDNVKVTGKFINRRSPGQPAKLCYIKYEDDPVKWYTFEDGKIYTIPRGFADQLNDHYFTPRFIQKTESMNPGEPGSVINEVDNSNKKYAFVPNSF